MTGGSMASFTDDLGRLKTNVSANGREKRMPKSYFCQQGG